MRVLVIALVFTIFIGRFEYKMPKRNFADFHVNYYTGHKMLKGENIYDDNAYRKNRMANFKYPPLFASITALFALTSEKAAATTWFIFNFILIIIFLFYSGKMIFNDKLVSRQRNWIYFWSLILTSRFYMLNFDEGQVNILMIATLFLGIYISRKGKDFIGGLLIGFSILIKYMSAIFIPYFLFKRKFKLVSYILFSLILFSILPAILWGWERNAFLQSHYFPYLCKTSLDANSMSDYVNQSLMSTIIRFFSNQSQYGINLMNLKDYHLGFFTGVSFILIYISCFLPNHKNSTDEKKECFKNIDIAMLSICAAFFNPNAWMHAFIFLTFGYMVLFRYLFQARFKDKMVLFLIILSFIFHSFTNSFLTGIWAKNFFEIYSFVTFGAIFVFLALLKIKFSPNLRSGDLK
jgi:hypothetical protein